MKKKFLAILLAAIMIVSLLPTMAFAEEGTKTYTLNLDGAQAVFAVRTDQVAQEKSVVAAAWTEEAAPNFLNEEYRSSFDCDTWSGYYSYLDSILPTKFSGSNGSFSITYTGDESKTSKASWGLLVLTDATVLTPGAAYTVYYGTSDSDGGAITIDPTPIATGNLCTDAPAAPSGSANIKGTITAGDFAYELVIPADTTLDESNYKDGVLLGSGDNAGLVTIAVTKHGADNVDVYYTVDLTNGNLTDGTTTITTNYKISDSATGDFSALAANTEYTVYTGGVVKNTYIKVSANETSWNNAPVGDYNATVVFNFDQEGPAAATVTIDDVFPKDLRVGTVNEFTNHSNCYYDSTTTVSAMVIAPNSELAAMFLEEMSQNVDNKFVIQAANLFIPLTTELTPIDGGYQCTVPIPNEVDEYFKVDFIMTGDTLSMIRLTDADYAMDYKMTYTPPEATTVADIASEMGKLTIINENNFYGLEYEENSLNLYDENDKHVKIATLLGTTALTASGDNWTCTVGDVTYQFNMVEGSLESITVSGMSVTYANGEYTGGTK